MYLFSVISNRTAALSSDWLAALIQRTFPLGTVAKYKSIQNYKPRQLINNRGTSMILQVVLAEVRGEC